MSDSDHPSVNVFQRKFVIPVRRQAQGLHNICASPLDLRIDSTYCFFRILWNEIGIKSRAEVGAIGAHLSVFSLNQDDFDRIPVQRGKLFDMLVMFHYAETKHLSIVSSRLLDVLRYEDYCATVQPCLAHACFSLFLDNCDTFHRIAGEAGILLGVAPCEAIDHTHASDDLSKNRVVALG